MSVDSQKILEFLKKSVKSDKISHAYLFAGPQNKGKKRLIFEFAKWLFKEDVEKKQHPDFIFIEPLKKEIQISQIRDCIWKLSLKPFAGDYKIALIDQAHCLNPEAQNCLLKTLEEPKGKAVLFLITEYPDLLFETIRSRCQIFDFPFFQKKEEEEELKRQEEKEKEIKKILNSDLALRFHYVKMISQNENLNEVLNDWLFYFRKILLSKLKQNQKILFSDINRLKEVQKISFLISTTNVNPKLALENLMLEL